jgi:hypothetical protein
MIELQCHVCGRPFPVDRADMLRFPPATYRACPGCREGVPAAPCEVTWSERGKFWSVSVPKCPLCGKKHYHGGGTGSVPDLGHRAAHCVDRAGSYELAETPESARERGRRAA